MKKGTSIFFALVKITLELWNIEIKAFWRKKVKYKQKENCILDVDHNLSKNNKNKEKNKSKIILS